MPNAPDAPARDKPFAWPVGFLPTKPPRSTRPIGHGADARTMPASLWAETVNACWPWRKSEYTGWTTQAAADLGISPATAKRYKSVRRPIPREIAERIAAYLEARAARALTLAGQWRAYAATRPTETHVGAALERRHGWRPPPV